MRGSSGFYALLKMTRSNIQINGIIEYPHSSQVRLEWGTRAKGGAPVLRSFISGRSSLFARALYSGGPWRLNKSGGRNRRS